MSPFFIALTILVVGALVAFRPIFRWGCKNEDGEINYTGGWADLAFVASVAAVVSLLWPLILLRLPFKHTTAEQVARLLGGEDRTAKHERKANEKAQALHERKAAHLEVVKANALESFKLGITTEDEYKAELRGAEQEFEQKILVAA